MARFVIAFLIAIAPSTVLAETPDRTLRWADLVPPGLAFDDPFRKLSEAQLHDLRTIANARVRRRAGMTLAQDQRDRLDKALARIRKAHIDADGLLARRAEIAAKRRRAAMSVEPALDGRTVAIKGFMLPLAASKGLVTELLLVPYVGACIHEPVPNANQIVRVSLAQGIVIDNRFAAAQVTGVLQTRMSTDRLYYVDGAAFVRSAYAIDGAAVQILRNKPACRDKYAGARKMFGMKQTQTCR